jgi:hypothetical protein
MAVGGFIRWQTLKARRDAARTPEQRKRAAAVRQAIADARAIAEWWRAGCPAGRRPLAPAAAREEALRQHLDSYVATLSRDLKTIGGRIEVAAVLPDGLRVALLATPEPAEPVLEGTGSSTAE